MVGRNEISWDDYRRIAKILVNQLNNEGRGSLLRSLLDNPSLFEFLRYNKIITSVAFFATLHKQPIPDAFEFKLKRYHLYLEEARKIGKILEREGIEYSIIKTFSPLPKDISDIDLLVNPEQANEARKLLLNLGYSLRKEGFEQDLYSKVVNRITIDIELHTSIAASSYEYYDTRHVLRESMHFNGVRVPEPTHSLLIISAHDVMKDLYIPLAHILDFYLLSHKADCDKLSTYSSLYGLTLPLLLFTTLTEITIGKSLTCKGYKDQLKSFLAIYVKIMKIKPVIKVQLPLALISYVENFQSKVKRKGFLPALKQLFSLPSGKGINTLLHNILPLNPEVKEIWE